MRLLENNQYIRLFITISEILNYFLSIFFEFKYVKQICMKYICKGEIRKLKPNLPNNSQQLQFYSSLYASKIQLLVLPLQILCPNTYEEAYQ